MINLVFYDADNDFEWVDVVSPTPEDYIQLSEKYTLHPASVKDCMSPSHLPKYEKIEGTVFMVTRVYDVGARQDADTIQQLTNKVAIFSSDKFFITIHRKDEPFLVALREEWIENYEKDGYTPSHLINQFIYKVIHSFDEILQSTTEQLDFYEKKIFVGTKDPQLIMDLYTIKRKASVFKRMMFLSKDSIDKFAKHAIISDPYTHDLVENASTLFFQADELHENVNNLLNLHISLASHRSNEIMNVLTVASVLFLPLTFIVGLYGMNFKYMPELDMEFGYPAVLLLMVTMTVGIYIWFKKKGWM